MTDPSRTEAEKISDPRKANAFALPYPPSVNTYWRNFRGRMVISKKGRIFRKKVCEILAELGTKPMAGRLLLTVTAFPPDNRRRDIDNILKALMDALQHGGAYADDFQIKKIIISMENKVVGGAVVAVVEGM